MARYHPLVRRLARYTLNALTVLSLVLCVATLLGWAGATLGDNATIRDYSSSLFALDLSGILAILAIFAHILGVENNRLVPPAAAKLFRNGRNRMGVLAILMAVSIAPPFWEAAFLGVQVRIYLWTLPLISYWLGRVARPQSRTYEPS